MRLPKPGPWISGFLIGGALAFALAEYLHGGDQAYCEWEVAGRLMELQAGSFARQAAELLDPLATEEGCRTGQPQPCLRTISRVLIEACKRAQ